MSTLDAKGIQNTVEVIVISDAFYTGLLGVANPRPKTAAAFYLWLADTNFKGFSMIDLLCRQLLRLRCSVSNVDNGITHLSRRKKGRSQAFRSLSFLQHWKAYTGPNYCLIFCRSFPLCFLSAISIFLSLGLANVHLVHWTLSPPHNE